MATTAPPAAVPSARTPEPHPDARRPTFRAPAGVRSAARTFLDLLALLALTLALGARVHAFTGFPEGNDAWGHLSKTRFVLDNWPHVSWNYEWYSGMPTFLGSYPPGYHVLVAAVAVVGHVSAITAMNVVALAGVLGIVVGVYGTVRAASHSRWAAVVAGAALLGTPTVWAQVVTYGLYPRLMGLAAVALAVACAARVAVTGDRLTMLGTAVCLAVGLSMHPVVGMAGLVLVAATIVVGTWWDLPRRAAAAVGILVLTGGLSAYFYLPLLLLPRSQSPWTDQEVNLTARMLLWAPGSALVGLAPVLLPLAVIVVGAAIAGLLRPRVPMSDKVALGTEITFLAMEAGAAVPYAASPAVRALAAWKLRQADSGFAARVLVVLVVGVPGVVAYGFIGYLVPHFPYYVNGLQPIDLLVYPAWLLSCVVGIGLGLVLRRRPGWTRRGLRLPVLAITATLTALGLLGTAAALPPGNRTNGSRGDLLRASGLPAAASADHQHRLAVATDSTGNFVNAVAPLPQTRGYQDHGNLQQDYQVWFEEALMGAPDQSPEVRDFLLDWNAVGWVMADPGVMSLDWEQADPALTPIATRSPYATFSVRGPGPVLSGSRAPTVLVLGDLQHYDLVLRALAQANIGSTALIPVQGPATLDGLSQTELSAYDTVLVYGATGADGSAASTLRRYAAGGGHLVVSDADAAGPARDLLAADSTLLPVSALRRRTVIDRWNWHTGADQAFAGVDLTAFAPPSYAGSGTWEVEVGQLISGGTAVLTSGKRLLAASHSLGRGDVTWDGFALPYHAASAKVATEGRLLGNLLGARATAPVVARTRFVSSEHRTVTVGPDARGVLVKEHLAPDWHATAGGHELTVRAAGPGMMWVSLPRDHRRTTVVLDYRLGLVERAGFALSGLAVIVLVLLAGLVVAWRRRRRGPSSVT